MAMPPESCSAAPLETVVLPVVEPKAVALAAVNAPALTVVLPS